MELNTHSGRPAPGRIDGTRALELWSLLVSYILQGGKGDIQFYLSDLNGGSGRFGFGRDRSGRTGEPVVDELLGVVFSDSCWLAMF